MEINFIFEDKFLTDDLSEDLLLKNCKRIVKSISGYEKIYFGTLNIFFCNSKTIKRYNRKYLLHNYETDIITFEYKEKPNSFTDSDILISYEAVRKNSVNYKTNFNEELFRVIIHGLLHLSGYKDKLVKDKRIMTEKENFYLKKIKLYAG